MSEIKVSHDERQYVELNAKERVEKICAEERGEAVDSVSSRAAELEFRYQGMTWLCSEILATLKVNIMRGSLKCVDGAGDDQTEALEALRRKWVERMSGIQATASASALASSPTENESLLQPEIDSSEPAPSPEQQVSQAPDDGHEFTPYPNYSAKFFLCMKCERVQEAHRTG